LDQEKKEAEEKKIGPKGEFYNYGLIYGERQNRAKGAPY
jgi:hypothetical protein